MLSRDGIGIGIAIKSFPPDGVETICVQPGNEFSAGSAGYAMWRVEIIPLPEKAAMVRRMPILTGVDPNPGQLQKSIDVWNDLHPAGNR